MDVHNAALMDKRVLLCNKIKSMKARKKTFLESGHFSSADQADSRADAFSYPVLSKPGTLRLVHHGSYL